MSSAAYAALTKEQRVQVLRSLMEADAIFIPLWPSTAPRDAADHLFAFRHEAGRINSKLQHRLDQIAENARNRINAASAQAEVREWWGVQHDRTNRMRVDLLRGRRA